MDYARSKLNYHLLHSAMQFFQLWKRRTNAISVRKARNIQTIREFIGLTISRLFTWNTSRNYVKRLSYIHAVVKHLPTALSNSFIIACSIYQHEVGQCHLECQFFCYLAPVFKVKVKYRFTFFHLIKPFQWTNEWLFPLIPKRGHRKGS